MPTRSTSTVTTRWPVAAFAGTVGPSTAGIGLWFGPCLCQFLGLFWGFVSPSPVTRSVWPSHYVVSTPGRCGATRLRPKVDCIINSATCTATTCTQPENVQDSGHSATADPQTGSVRFTDHRRPAAEVPESGPRSRRIAWKNSGRALRLIRWKCTSTNIELVP